MERLTSTAAKTKYFWYGGWRVWYRLVQPIITTAWCSVMGLVMETLSSRRSPLQVRWLRRGCFALMPSITRSLTVSMIRLRHLHKFWYTQIIWRWHVRRAHILTGMGCITVSQLHAVCNTRTRLIEYNLLDVPQGHSTFRMQKSETITTIQYLPLTMTPRHWNVGSYSLDPILVFILLRSR